MSITQRIGITLLLAAVYFGAGKFGLSLAHVNASASAVWPPSGLALAVLIVWGRGLWPSVFLGAFLVNATTQGTALTALFIAAGNTLEALAGASLVHRFGGVNPFQKTSSILWFALIAAPVSTAIGATAGVTALTLTGFAEWPQLPPIWLTWWLGDLSGDVVIAPFLVLWAAKRLPRRVNWEAAVLATVILLASAAIFVLLEGWPVAYLTLPPLVWASIRFGVHGAAAAAFSMSGLALWGTLHGAGPFAGLPPNESLLVLQGFMSTITVVSLLLAAAVAERIATGEALRGLVQEKEALLDELHHRIRNNLQLIVSMLHLQSGEVRDAEAAMALRKAYERVNSIALVHERLYRSQELASLDMEEFLRDLAEHLVRLRKEQQDIAVRVHAEGITFPVTAAVPCGLIVNELITNALKHAFPEGVKGEVVVSLTNQSDGGYVLSVKDNGIGLPKDFVSDQAPGLGLHLIHALAKQLHGHLVIEREGGTTFSIVFSREHGG